MVQAVQEPHSIVKGCKGFSDVARKMLRQLHHPANPSNKVFVNPETITNLVVPDALASDKEGHVLALVSHFNEVQ
jgi:hypothetical protein